MSLNLHPEDQEASLVSDDIKIEHLRFLVKAAAHYGRHPEATNKELARALGVSEQKVGRTFEILNRNMDYPWFKRALVYKREVLWDDIKPDEVPVAKKAFPNASIEPSGLSPAGFHFAQAVQHFFDRVVIAQYIDRPAIDYIPTLTLTEVDARRLAVNLRPNKFQYEDLRQGLAALARPWDYRTAGLRRDRRWPKEIPELWKESKLAGEPIPEDIPDYNVPDLFRGFREEFFEDEVAEPTT